jgi:uncharacterized protein
MIPDSFSPRALVVGASGFVGRGLTQTLLARGWNVTGISRSGRGPDGPDRWTTLDQIPWQGHQALVNLAGEPVNRRWTRAGRQAILESRTQTTRRLAAGIAALPPESRPSVWVNASAVGYYGDRGDDPLEETQAAGAGFLAEVCRQWEQATEPASDAGVRVVLLRIGIVLGRQAPAFESLRTVFSLGLGGRLGSGRQWMPWIHADDLSAAILHALETPELRGPVNACAPQPVRNADFTRVLARTLRRPALLPAPGFALRLALGGFGAALLHSQRALPAALQSTGFRFRHAELDEALRDLLAVPSG